MRQSLDCRERRSQVMRNGSEHSLAQSRGPRCFTLSTSPLEKLRDDYARPQEREQYDPVDSPLHGECSVWCEEEHIEAKKCESGEHQAKWASPARTGGKHHDQVHESDVRFVQHTSQRK
jgi:hypothetical protein